MLFKFKLAFFVLGLSLAMSSCSFYASQFPLDGLTPIPDAYIPDGQSAEILAAASSTLSIPAPDNAPQARKPYRVMVSVGAPLNTMASDARLEDSETESGYKVFSTLQTRQQ